MNRGRFLKKQKLRKAFKSVRSIGNFTECTAN